MESLSGQEADRLLTCSLYQNERVNVNQKSTESPILDLSFKKIAQKPLLGNQTDVLNFSTTVTDDQRSDVQFIDSERKSPFEGRTFMVTPPSETDSPKKNKYESIYDHTCVPTSSVIDQYSNLSILPTNTPVHIPTVLTALPIPDVTQNTSTITKSYTENVTNTTVLDSIKKVPRPFKAYPKDPLALTVGTPELMYNQHSNEAYTEFRNRMLESVRRTNEGTNTKMRRVIKSPVLPTSTADEREKDTTYWERRKKNNEAAKRSRDARRAKEDEIAIRAAFLEQENMKLKYELVALRNEAAKLRCMIYSS